MRGDPCFVGDASGGVDNDYGTFFVSDSIGFLAVENNVVSDAAFGI